MIKEEKSENNMDINWNVYSSINLIKIKVTWSNNLLIKLIIYNWLLKYFKSATKYL